MKKYENFDILNEVEDENLIKAKMELILGGIYFVYWVTLLFIKSLNLKRGRKH